MINRLHVSFGLFGVALVLFIMPVVVSAQLALPGFTDLFTIVAIPASPGPHQAVHLSLEGALDTNIAWTINGKPVQADEDGEIDIVTGGAGEKMIVEATVEATSGTQTLSMVINPLQVDLLIDAPTYTPPFFKGRALASAGTTLRAQAIPHLVTTAGTAIPSDQIIFTWRQNTSVIASGKGKSTITLAAPPLFGADTISVEARSQDGVYAGSASVRLPGIDPTATLYVRHPLTGIAYYNAVQSGGSVPDTETTLVAVPYFVDARNPGDASLVYEWGINGRSVPAEVASANEITINADNSAGVADLSLTLSSTANFYMHADQSWNIHFPGSGGTIPGVIPQSSSSNIFHEGIQ